MGLGGITYRRACPGDNTCICRGKFGCSRRERSPNGTGLIWWNWEHPDVLVGGKLLICRGSNTKVVWRTSSECTPRRILRRKARPATIHLGNRATRDKARGLEIRALFTRIPSIKVVAARRRARKYTMSLESSMIGISRTPRLSSPIPARLLDHRISRQRWRVTIALVAGSADAHSKCVMRGRTPEATGPIVSTSRQRIGNVRASIFLSNP